LFGFTADDVIKIKRSNNKNVCALFDAVNAYSETEGELASKCKKFVDELRELRSLSRSLPADKVIRRVYDRFSFLSKGSSRADLITLYENARSYEGDTFKGLYSYLKYLQEMIDNEISIGKGGDDAPDCVRLMTMHKSKGLEFPVCFVAGCAKPFNRDDAKDLLLYSSRLGIATDLSDETGFGKIRTPYRKALSRLILDESAEEEMRVLYVALTRGRERLYVTANPRWGAERELSIAKTARLYGKRAAILDSSDYLSWILTAIHGADENNEDFALSILKYEDIPTLPTPSDTHEEVITESTEVNEELEEIIKNNLDYEYPYLHIANLPAKLSVSKLTPSVLDRNDEAIESDPETLDVKLPSILLPSFMADEQKPSGAAKGTATHTFLQFCDFENAIKSGVEEELQRLIHHGFMARSMEKLVNVGQIATFLRSPLYSSISKAKKVYREQRFNILLPAKEFTMDDEYARLIENEKLLVQGVIDIFFEDENGKLILCDYKTDFLTSEEKNDKSLAAKKLSTAHSRQLSYYAAALKEICGRAPDKVLIYSLPLGDSVEIDV
jgi:ATP-dependent helicase/nuclease subunit A